MRLEAKELRQIVQYAVIILALLFGWKFAPVYVAATRFKVEVYEATRDTATMRGTPDSLRKRIAWSAQNLDIPLRPEDVHVEVDRESKLVTARTAYVVPVDLLFRTVHLKFHSASSQLPMISAADFKVEVPGEASVDSVPGTSGGPSVPHDVYTNPPSRSNSQSAN